MIELPETFDTYLIPGTNVLRNLIGATTVTELEAAENDLVSARMLEFQSNLPVAQGTLRQLQQIHRQLFQDIYDWAGQIRTVEAFRCLVWVSGSGGGGAGRVVWGYGYHVVVHRRPATA